jgi:hypothetical protein
MVRFAPRLVNPAMSNSTAEALTGRYFDRADRSYVVRGYQRCNVVADLQQSLGHASTAINRVVLEQKRPQCTSRQSQLVLPNPRRSRQLKQLPLNLSESVDLG